MSAGRPQPGTDKSRPSTIRGNDDAALAEIAVRAHVEPLAWKARKRRQTQEPWPELALLLRTVSVPAAGEPLWFGVYAVLPSTALGTQPIGEGIFYREGIPSKDVEALKAYAAARGLPEPLPLDAFLRRFYKLAYKKRLPVVGFGLPVHLARLAADWGEAEGFYAGGFSLILWTKKPPGERRSKAERRRRPLLRNGRIDDGFRPRISLRAIDGQRAFIAFRRRGRPDREDLVPEGKGGKPKRGYGFPGRFVDLRTFAFGLTGEVYAAGDEACRALGLPCAPVERPRQSSLGGRVELARAELREEAGLYLVLLAEHRARVDEEFLSPDDVYSPASYADALYAAARLNPPLLKWPSFPRDVLGKTMAAYFGGESMVGVRALPWPLPVRYLDYSGLYLLVAVLTGAFDLLAAERVDVIEEDAEDVKAWIASLTREKLLDRATWPRLGTSFVEIVPDGDVLPHKVRSGKAWILKVAPLTRSKRQPFTLACAVVSFLETGRVPNVVSAFRIVPRGRQRSLRAVTLAGGRAIEPGEDLFLALGEERLRLAADRRLPADERRRLSRFYKLVGSAACSGLLAQVNEREPRKKGERVEVWGPDGTRRERRLPSVEEPGRWYFPPLAASITGAGRLLLHLTRLLFETAGGTVAYSDTDSFAVVSTAEGGLVPCPGGPERTEDGREAVRALSYAEVEAVRREIEALNPYPRELSPVADVYAPGAPAVDPFGQPLEQPGGYVRIRQPALLKLESENFDGGPAWPRQAHLHARASKAYDLYFLERPGPHVELCASGSRVVLRPGPTETTIVKASEHGLGHLLDPRDPEGRDKAWIAEGKAHLLERDLGLESREPEWFAEPGLSRIALTRYDDLARLGEGRDGRRTRRESLRPWSRIAVAHPDPLVARRAEAGGERLTPIAPWHEGFDTGRARWRSLGTGRPLRVRVQGRELRERDLAADGPVPVQTMTSLLLRHGRRAEKKALAADGAPCGPESAGLLSPAPTEAHKLVLIGRESNNLDRVGVTDDPDYAVYSDLEEEAWREFYLPAFRALAPTLPGGLAGLAREEGIPRSTLERAFKTGRTSRRVRLRLAPLIGRLAAEALRAEGASPMPADPEKACYLYLRRHERSTPRSCVGCGATLAGRQRRWCAECRARPRVRRRAEAAHRDERTCAGCRAPLAGRQRRWCSDACRKRADRSAGVPV